MIDLHYWPTPNGWKVAIMLEECGLAYRTIAVDIGGGDQFKPGFLRISPNNRMPAIVDHEPHGGGAPLALFESGAILEYLADKTGQFLPRAGAGRYAVLQWVHWQMANLGPMMGNANHFKNYAKHLVDDPDQLAYGTRRFVGEVDRLCGVMDAQLSAHRHLAGDDYTIADIVAWPSSRTISILLRGRMSTASQGAAGSTDARRGASIARILGALMVVVASQISGCGCHRAPSPVESVAPPPPPPPPPPVTERRGG